MANPERNTNKFSRYLLWSYAALAVVLVIFILTSVILDSVLGSTSLAFQRWLLVLTLILPALFGVVMGVLELRQPNRRLLLACVAILLNGLVALFFIAVLGIAG